MNEILFLVETAPEGEYTARALGETIFTEADNLEDCIGRSAMRLFATSKKGRRPV